MKKREDDLSNEPGEVKDFNNLYEIGCRKLKFTDLEIDEFNGIKLRESHTCVSKTAYICFEGNSFVYVCSEKTEKFPFGYYVPFKIFTDETSETPWIITKCVLTIKGVSFIIKRYLLDKNKTFLSTAITLTDLLIRIEDNGEFQLRLRSEFYDNRIALDPIVDDHIILK